MKPPVFLSGRRRGLFLALIGAGTAQAVSAGLSAHAFSSALGPQPMTPGPVLAMGGGVLLMASAVLAERWIGEALAQSYVTETRDRLVTAALRSRAQVEESRLILPFVGDLSAVRNWATRGPARLISSGVAGGVGLIAFLVAFPQLWPSLIPFVVGGLGIGWLYRRLEVSVTAQRRVRGRLTRFILQQIRNLPETRSRLRKRERVMLDGLSRDLSAIAIGRSRQFGLLETIAVAASGCAAIGLVLLSRTHGHSGHLIAGLTLLGFCGGRLLELVRALHAQASGRVAMAQINQRLRVARKPRPQQAQILFMEPKL